MDKEALREYWEDFIGLFKRSLNRLKRRVPQILGEMTPEELTTIVVDLDGGDKAPEAIIRGIKKAINEGFIEPQEIIAIGTKEAVVKFEQRSWLTKNLSWISFFKNPLEGVLVLECVDKIEMDDDPKTCLRKNRSSAMGNGINMIKNNKASALVSAGNTAGMVTLGAIILGRLGKNLKPAIAVPIPNDAGPCLILDAGAIHRASAEDLLNCAIMGSIYAEMMWQITNPSVKLLNIGRETGKGNQDLKEAEGLLLDNSHRQLADGSWEGRLNFQGNIEGDAVFSEPANVIVCSGEMGNNTIKVGEGVLNLIKNKMGIVWKAISFFWNHHKRSDYKEVGGAILLGVKGVLIISHGKSDSMAVANAIRRAKQEVRAGIVQKIAEKI